MEKEQDDQTVRMFGQWVLRRLVEKDDPKFPLVTLSMLDIENAAIDMGLLDWDDQKQRCVPKKKEH